MKILVTGGRDFSAMEDLEKCLDYFNEKCAQESIPLFIGHGDAKGADFYAKLWAVNNNVPQTPYPADWVTHGKAAGPIRNSQMLSLFQPDLCVACPGGNGTADMVKKCLKAGVPVLQLTDFLTQIKEAEHVSNP